MSGTEKTYKNLFEKLYDGSAELIKKMKMPSARKNLQIKLTNGYNNAQIAIDSAENNIHEEVMKVLDVDMQVILNEKSKIRNNREAQEDIKEVYKELFSKDMPVDEEEAE